jgi:hypothetical protein
MRLTQVVTDLKRISLVAAAVMILGACAYADPNTEYARGTEKRDRVISGDPNQEAGSILGPGGLNIFGEDEAAAQDGSGGGIGVNGFLWRASLDTISFMPLASADPFGGVIITDWYSPPETQDERFKVTVYILGRDLRADGIRAAVFRQRQDAAGTWTDAAVQQKTTVDLENAILTRARQLRVAGLL